MMEKSGKRSSSGKHMDLQVRLRIERAVAENAKLPKEDRLSFNALADSLGIPRSTFSRERKRGRVEGSCDGEDIVGYSARKAQEDADLKVKNKVGPSGKITKQIAEALVHLIKEEKLSPAGALLQLKARGFKNVPCLRTVYNHIDHGKLSFMKADTPRRRKIRA